MPELPEVEAYRRLAEGALGRRVRRAEVLDRRFVRGRGSPEDLVAAAEGSVVAGVRRHGKLLVLDLRRARTTRTVGLRFGMTGRLLLDGRAGVDRLVFAGEAARPAWDRVRLVLDGGSHLVVNDPRLLGGVELDPDELSLGPDALTVTPAGLRRALEASTVALKTRLMDQRRLAGVGNLVADEVLWRASLAPQRPSASLADVEHRRLHRHLRATLEVLLARGGSHLGDLMPERATGGRCPRDGAELVRSTVGGRTTWWCPAHQR